MMRLKKTATSLLLAAGLASVACIPKQKPGSSSASSTSPESSASQAPTVGSTGPAPAMEKSLAQHFATSFSFGIAMEAFYLEKWGALTASTFNRLTAENAMKLGQIQKMKGKYDFESADALANFAREHSMKMTGHAIVWYRETPTWFAQGNLEEVSARLKDHTFVMIERYADVTDNWDVVNEAISDTETKMYRDVAEGSKLYGVLGDKLPAIAFQHAEAAVKATGKDIDLYYNDYNMWQTVKLDKALKMAKGLRAAGIRIDGIGAQGHWNMTSPTAEQLQTMIDKIVAAGLKVKISELDISVYSGDDWVKEVWEKERPFDDALAQAQAARYKELFEIFVKNAEHITSVTLWGMSDHKTWLDNFPIKRNNYPLLFDDNDKPKPAYFALFEVASPAQ